MKEFAPRGGRDPESEIHVSDDNRNSSNLGDGLAGHQKSEFLIRW